MNPYRLAPWLLTAGLALTGAACGGDAAMRMPDKTKEAVDNPAPVKLPGWTQGEYPFEASFFGYGMATTQEGEEQAKAKAMELIVLEIGILTQNLKDDHEEQVAEIISRYPPASFNAHVDAVAAAVLDKAERVERFDDAGRGRIHVFFKLPFSAIFAALDAREGLPDEQKVRLRNYEGTFIENALIGLGRKGDE